jgi:hypothetical protein
VLQKIPQVELSALKKIAPGDFRLLWVNDWYDGPIEAVVELTAGEPCLMVLHSEDPTSDKSPYRWLILRLTPEQRADEEKWHALFVEHVGDHWCFHDDTTTYPHPKKPSATPSPEKFYDQYRARSPLDVSNNEVLGWADEMPAR